MARNWASMATVVVLVVLAGTTVVVAGGTDGTYATADGATDPGSGARLAGLVGVQDAEIRGTVSDETLGARLEAASGPGERATLLGERLNASQQRLDELESRLRSLDRGRENGSLDGDAYAARAAAVHADVRSIERNVDQVAAFAADLPADVRQERRLAARIETVESRASDLRDRTETAAAALEPSGESAGARPFTLAEVTAVVERGVSVPSALRGVAGSERINVHVRRANGTTAVFFARTEGGEVVSVERGGIDDPSLRVYTDYRVIRNVGTADDPAAAVQSAIDAGRITYDGVGIVNSAKYGFAKLASLVASAVLWLVALIGLAYP